MCSLKFADGSVMKVTDDQRNQLENNMRLIHGVENTLTSVCFMTLAKMLEIFSIIALVVYLITEVEYSLKNVLLVFVAAIILEVAARWHKTKYGKTKGPIDQEFGL